VLSPSYTNTGLTNGTTYYYRVVAFNNSGNSGPSNEASATPAASSVPSTPTGLTASAGNGQVTLNWNASTGAMFYNVYRGTTPGGQSTTPVASNVLSPSYTNTGLTNGTTYYYRVVAFNNSGNSGPSNEASATPAGDSARYNFEASAQGWVSSGGMITSVARSTTQHFAGSAALAVNINCTTPGGEHRFAQVANPANVAAGNVITFRVWIPSGSTINVVQPFVLQGASGGWTWTGTVVPIGSLTTNAWNTITVTVPSNAVLPLAWLGVEFDTTGVWAGTCYVDTVNW
jgi:hypothetical protein